MQNVEGIKDTYYETRIALQQHLDLINGLLASNNRLRNQPTPIITQLLKNSQRSKIWELETERNKLLESVSNPINFLFLYYAHIGGLHIAFKIGHLHAVQDFTRRRRCEGER